MPAAVPAIELLRSIPPPVFREASRGVPSAFPVCEYSLNGACFPGGNDGVGVVGRHFQRGYGWARERIKEPRKLPRHLRAESKTPRQGSRGVC